MTMIRIALWLGFVLSYGVSLLIPSASYSLPSPSYSFPQSRSQRRQAIILQSNVNSNIQTKQPLQTGEYARMPQAMLFHPAFPFELIQPLTAEDVQQIENLQRATNALLTSDPYLKEYERLPWSVLPSIGVKDSSSEEVMSSKLIDDLFALTRHRGTIIWAKKVDRLAAGVLLVNHWQQKLVLLTKYDPLTGAAGAVLNARSLRTFATSALTETSLRTPESNLSSLAQQLVVGEEDVLTWPPLALEFEIQAKKWQMVEVSPSMLTPAVLSKLPASMPTALWEIVCLCLLRVEEDSTVLQALLDTGISPRQGFLAYLRLLHRVLSRTETFDDIPGYRQIMNMKV